jgi:hypothetical protein
MGVSLLRKMRTPADLKRLDITELPALATEIREFLVECLVIKQRRVKNQRLAAAGYTWTSAALTASPEARAHHDPRLASSTGRRRPRRSVVRAESTADDPSTRD